MNGLVESERAVYKSCQTVWHLKQKLEINSVIKWWNYYGIS